MRPRVRFVPWLLVPQRAEDALVRGSGTPGCADATSCVTSKRGCFAFIPMYRTRGVLLVGPRYHRGSAAIASYALSPPSISAVWYSSLVTPHPFLSLAPSSVSAAAGSPHADFLPFRLSFSARSQPASFWQCKKPLLKERRRRGARAEGRETRPGRETYTAQKDS